MAKTKRVQLPNGSKTYVIELSKGVQYINMLQPIKVYGDMKENFKGFLKYTREENRGWICEDGSSTTNTGANYLREKVL